MADTIQRFLSTATMAEQREWRRISRLPGATPDAAVRAVERLRRNAAISVDDLRDSQRQQANRRTVPSAHVYA